MTQRDAILTLFQSRPNDVLSIQEVDAWAQKQWPGLWKTLGYAMSDLEVESCPSTSYRREDRFLRRVGPGRYKLARGQNRPGRAEKKRAAEKPSSVRSRPAAPQATFEVRDATPARAIVTASSATRFEPKGEHLALRAAIRAAVLGLRLEAGGVLHGVHLTTSRERSDAENILFYNVGGFGGLGSSGVRFERGFRVPSHFLGDVHRSHCFLYYAAPPAGGFRCWKEGDLVAEWSVEVNPRSLSSASAVWALMRRAQVKVHCPDPMDAAQFGLSVRVTGAPSNSSAMALVKPVFDGAVAAFHAHDGTQLDDLAARVARKCSEDAEWVRRELMDARCGVLGSRRLVVPWGDAVQWQPGDDGCVAGELQLERGGGRACQMSGRLFSLKEKQPELT